MCEDCQVLKRPGQEQGPAVGVEADDDLPRRHCGHAHGLELPLVRPWVCSQVSCDLTCAALDHVRQLARGGAVQLDVHLMELRGVADHGTRHETSPKRLRHGPIRMSRLVCARAYPDRLQSGFPG